jgi:hypothetical protein
MAAWRTTVGGAGVGRVALRVPAAITLSVLALLACGGGVAAAADPGSLTFATAQPLTLTWAQLLHGRTTEVCNGGAATVPRLQVVPEDFQFTREGDTVAPSQVLVVKTPTHPVRAGECAPLHIALKSEAPIDAGEYAGSLLLVAAGHGGSARLTTTVMTSSKKDPAPTGAAEPTALSIHLPSPWSHSASATLLLKEPSSSEEALAIGRGCGRSQQPSESYCPVLGNLYQNSSVVRVSVDGPSRLNRDKGVQEVPIELHGFQHPVGTYEGTITLPGSTQAIKLELTAKDAWWCAVVALLLGILLALVTQLWNGRWQPRSVLVERAESLWERYGTKPVQGHKRVEMDCSKLEEYVGGVKAAITQYVASVVMCDTTSDAYKAIDASLKLAEADAAVFAGPGGLEPALDQLEAETKATIKVLSRVQVTDVPEILKAASALLGGDKLGVGGASKRVNESEQLLPVLIAWRELAENFANHVVALKVLASRANLEKQDLKDELTDLGVRMSGLRRQLFEANDAAGLGALRSAERFWRTLDGVALLGQKHKADPYDPRDFDKLKKDASGNLEMKAANGQGLKAIGYSAKQGDAFSFEEVIEEPAGAVIEPAKPATLPERKRRRILGDRVALGVTIVVSIIAGLSTFYFTKSFGTFTDYLTVIVIGAAAQTLLKGILNQTSILLHDIAPESPVVPAKVVAPAPAGVKS